MIIHRGMFCVYFHRVDGKVFYVGQGTHERPFVSKSRNEKWNKMVAISGSFDVEIFGWFMSKKDALKEEAEQIVRLKPYANSTIKRHSTAEQSPSWSLPYSVTRGGCKPVLEVTTGKLFRSCADAGIAFGMSGNSVATNARGRTKTASGYIFRFTNVHFN